MHSSTSAHSKKRYVWSDALHRDFIAAVFDVGLRFSTAHELRAALPQLRGRVSDAQFDGFLQKMRLFRDRNAHTQTHTNTHAVSSSSAASSSSSVVAANAMPTAGTTNTPFTVNNAVVLRHRAPDLSTRDVFALTLAHTQTGTPSGKSSDPHSHTQALSLSLVSQQLHQLAQSIRENERRAHTLRHEVIPRQRVVFLQMIERAQRLDPDFAAAHIALLQPQRPAQLSLGNNNNNNSNANNNNKSNESGFGSNADVFDYSATNNNSTKSNNKNNNNDNSNNNENSNNNSSSNRTNNNKNSDNPHHSHSLHNSTHTQLNALAQLTRPTQHTPHPQRLSREDSLQQSLSSKRKFNVMSEDAHYSASETLSFSSSAASASASNTRTVSAAPLSVPHTKPRLSDSRDAEEREGNERSLTLSHAQSLPSRSGPFNTNSAGVNSSTTAWNAVHTLPSIAAMTNSSSSSAPNVPLATSRTELSILSEMRAQMDLHRKLLEQKESQLSLLGGVAPFPSSSSNNSSSSAFLLDTTGSSSAKISAHEQSSANNNNNGTNVNTNGSTGVSLATGSPPSDLSWDDEDLTEGLFSFLQDQ